jgi:hypothetical protein
MKIVEMDKVKKKTGVEKLSEKSHELPRAAKPMQLVLSSASRDYSRVARTNVISPTHSELPQWHSIACEQKSSTAQGTALSQQLEMSMYML